MLIGCYDEKKACIIKVSEFEGFTHSVDFVLVRARVFELGYSTVCSVQTPTFGVFRGLGYFISSKRVQ